MLTLIVKVITSTALIFTLIFVVTKRDFSVPAKNFLKKITSQSEKYVSTSESVLLQKSIISPATTELEVATQTPILPIPPLSKTPKVTPESITPKFSAVYEHISEGPSDTDESYRPSVSPCTVSMGYKLGTFDSRFGISKTMFLQEINQASETWGDAIGKKLFYYDENGPLTINLIYDERQAKTEEINYLSLEIENSEQSAEHIKKIYEQERAVYSTDEKKLIEDGENFKIRYDAYMSKVATYNQAGGASKPEYDTMMYELNQLKQETTTLEERRLSLLASSESINKKVLKYNELILYVNSLIKKSNALGTKKFTEGKFSPGTNTIDIYQYDSSTKLRRVITHELGHVLGINHNKNVYSIMYTVNSATTTILSKEDTASLISVCQAQ